MQAVNITKWEGANSRRAFGIPARLNIRLANVGQVGSIHALERLLLCDKSCSVFILQMNFSLISFFNLVDNRIFI